MPSAHAREPPGRGSVDWQHHQRSAYHGPQAPDGNGRFANRLARGLIGGHGSTLSDDSLGTGLRPRADAQKEGRLLGRGGPSWGYIGASDKMRADNGVTARFVQNRTLGRERSSNQRLSQAFVCTGIGLGRRIPGFSLS